MNGDNERAVRYACLAGHDIPAADLDRLTEVTRLDAGAEIRLCREHGCPVSLSVDPMREGRS